MKSENNCSSPESKRSYSPVDNVEFHDQPLALKEESESFRNSALGVKKFFCEICDFACFFEKTLLDHKISDHDGGLSHFCQKCDRRFKEKQDVEHHILVEHLHPSSYWRKGTSQKETRNFKCEECGNSFNQKVHLQKHLKIHELQKERKCVICEKSFTSEDLLLSHVRNYHTEVAGEIPSSMEPGWRCSKCGKSFKNHKNLRKHIDNIHGREIDTISDEDNEDIAVGINSNIDPDYYPASAKRKTPVPESMERFESGGEQDREIVENRLADPEQVNGGEERIGETIAKRLNEVLERSEQTDDAVSVSEVEQIAATPTSVEDLTTRTPEDLRERLGAKLDEPVTPVAKVNRCLICRSVFASFNELKQHVSDTHKPRKQVEQPQQPRKCLICKLLLPNIEKLKEHVHTVHALSQPQPVTTTSAAMTSSQFDQSADNFDEGVVGSLPDVDEFGSASGDIELDSLSGFDPSMFDTSLTKSPEPSAVDRSFDSKDYKCNQCNRTFKYRWNFDRDQEMHLKQLQRSKAAAIKAAGKEWMLDCPHCSEHFVDKIAMIQHIKKAHEAQPKHVCEICNESFTRKYLLMSHVETQHPETLT